MNSGSWYPSRAAAALGLCFFTGFAAAGEGALIPAAMVPAAGAGLGLAMRFENSPYRGGGMRNDLVPLYVYEGKRVFLEAYRFGLKLNETPDSRFDVFLGYRSRDSRTTAFRLAWLVWPIVVRASILAWAISIANRGGRCLAKCCTTRPADRTAPRSGPATATTWPSAI